ncbi:MAG TPA: hypothetical protein ENK19_09910, partial [Acidobacteria bacterium]|nr:hypothetical protein [Acidobacteriota bacterium]
SRKEIPLWRECRVTRVAAWPGSLVGEKYEVRNISAQDQRLSEREFGILGDDVVAVSITHTMLPPNSSTEVYVIRRPED